eukprot:Sspe_Gene.22443::Locus_8543_Transcript_1_1_Confidence_1.000_Length_2235::g.22443::m.22443
MSVQTAVIPEKLRQAFGVLLAKKVPLSFFDYVLCIDHYGHRKERVCIVTEMDVVLAKVDGNITRTVGIPLITEVKFKGDIVGVKVPSEFDMLLQLASESPAQGQLLTSAILTAHRRLSSKFPDLEPLRLSGFLGRNPMAELGLVPPKGVKHRRSLTFHKSFDNPPPSSPASKSPSPSPPPIPTGSPTKPRSTPAATHDAEQVTRNHSNSIRASEPDSLQLSSSTGSYRQSCEVRPVNLRQSSNFSATTQPVVEEATSEQDGECCVPSPHSPSPESPEMSPGVPPLPPSTQHSNPLHSLPNGQGADEGRAYYAANALPPPPPRGESHSSSSSFPTHLVPPDMSFASRDSEELEGNNTTCIYSPPCNNVPVNLPPPPPPRDDDPLSVSCSTHRWADTTASGSIARNISISTTASSLLDYPTNNALLREVSESIDPPPPPPTPLPLRADVEVAITQEGDSSVLEWVKCRVMQATNDRYDIRIHDTPRAVDLGIDGRSVACVASDKVRHPLNVDDDMVQCLCTCWCQQPVTPASSVSEAQPEEFDPTALEIQDGDTYPAEVAPGWMGGGPHVDPTPSMPTEDEDEVSEPVIVREAKAAKRVAHDSQAALTRAMAAEVEGKRRLRLSQQQREKRYTQLVQLRALQLSKCPVPLLENAVTMALCPYRRKSHDELTINMGDKLEAVPNAPRTRPGWRYWRNCRTGEVGVVPDDHVT